jgi:hypothetical protein
MSVSSTGPGHGEWRLATMLNEQYVVYYKRHRDSYHSHRRKLRSFAILMTWYHTHIHFMYRVLTWAIKNACWLCFAFPFLFMHGATLHRQRIRYTQAWSAYVFFLLIQHLGP